MRPVLQSTVGDGNPNEDKIGERLFGSIANIQHDEATGYYLTSFIRNVASEEHREKSASGGLATWLLAVVLLKNEIDAAICVSPTKEPETLFKYSVMRDIESME